MFDRSSGNDAGASTPVADATDSVGKKPQAQGDDGLHPTRAAAVDRALDTIGSGEAQPSGARFHTDATAAHAAEAINANAFTAGQDVFFGAGHYNPGTSEGDRIIGHEMAHVQQTQGVAAPSPGNFSIASTSSHEETSARAGTASMGSAAPSTIFRDPTVGQSLQSTMTPFMGAQDAQGFGATIGTASAIGQSGADKDKDALQAFRYAVLGGAADDIEAKWKNLKAIEKIKLKAEPDVILKMIEAWGPKSMHALPWIGVSIGSDERYAQHILWQANVADWKAQMSAVQWAQFIASDPKKDKLDKKSLEGLNQAMKIAGSEPNATHIFNRAFAPLQTDPKLADTDYTKVKVAHWTTDRMARLFDIFAKGTLPVNHILAATGGIILISQQQTRKAPTDKFGAWEVLGFAWFQPWNSVVVLPEHSSGADGGGVRHDMVGGQGAQSAAPVGPVTHLEGSALHEIGHAVGQNIRGNNWVESGTAPPKWTKVAEADAKAALWDKAANIEPGGGAKKLPEADAKDYLYNLATQQKHPMPVGWTLPDFQYAIQTQYFNQPLYKLAAGAGGNGDNAYNQAVVHGGWAYAYLSRWDSQIGKYTEAAYNSKVSWYSMSSPLEWFAEQYVQYHKTNGTGTGMDGTTLAYMKDLDTRSAAAPGADPAGTPPPPPGAAAQGAPQRAQFPWAW